MESGAKIRVRLARGEDMLDVLVVRIASWREAYRGILPQEYLDGLRRATRIDLPPATWIVESDRIVTGYLATDLPGAHGVRETVEIRELYVHPNYWRNGLGAALFESCAEELAARGVRELYLWVLEANERGRRFYEAMGFGRVSGERKLVPTGGERFPVLLYRILL